MTFFKLLIPGLQLKRWMLLLLVGLVFLSLGLTYLFVEFYRSVPLPAVAGAGVVGGPDPVSGEAIIAFVVLVEGAATTVDALRSHLETQLAPYKIPQRVNIIDELPANVSGKVDRTALKRIASAAP